MQGLTDGLSEYDRRRFESAMRRLAETGAEALEVARAAVWIYGPDRDRLHRVHLYHRSSREHVAGGELRREQYPAYFEALAEDPVVAASDVHDDPRTAELSDTYAGPLGLTSWLDVPLPGGPDEAAPRGIVRFEQLGPRRHWSDAEVALARGLGAAVSAVLAYFQTRRERTGEEPPSPPEQVEEPSPPEPGEEPPPVEPVPEEASTSPPPPPATEGPPPGAGEPGEEPPPEGAATETTPVGAGSRADAEFMAWRVPAGMALTTREGKILSCNPALAQMLGNARPTELEGSSLRPRVSRTEDWDEMVERVDREGRVDGWELRVQRPDGSRVWLLVGAVGAGGSDAERLVLSAVNITERKKVEERLERLANRDPLTGAANRRLLQETAESTLALADRHGRNVALLYVDLRDFKDVNDNYGHEIGDRVLTHVADRLRARGRESDLVARIGGDEFAVLLAEVEGEEGARKAAERFMDGLRPPIQVDGLVVQVEVTIGMAIYPAHARDVRSLLRLADQAMYRGKEWECGRIVVWDGEQEEDDADAEQEQERADAEPTEDGNADAERTEDRNGETEQEEDGPEEAEDVGSLIRAEAPPEVMNGDQAERGPEPDRGEREGWEPDRGERESRESDRGERDDPDSDGPEPGETGDDRFLVDALEESRLDLHWQPIVRGADGAMVGAEALLRWEHPERGQIRAREFVGRAEELGWIRSFDSWVVDRVAPRLEQWRRAGRLEWVAVNVSPHSLLSSEFMSSVFQRVEEGRLVPGSVLVQTTVDLDGHPTSEVGRSLAELRTAGFGTALDLTGEADELVEVILSALQLDVLEVVPDFLRRMEGRKLGRTVSRTRKERGLRLLAKRIETEGQHRQAREFGCELIQGLHLGRPVPAAEIDGVGST